MEVCYDTNILLTIIRDKSRQERVRGLVNPNAVPELISWVSVIEMRSLGYRAQWGQQQYARLNKLLNSLTVISVENEQIIGKYLEIDAFSQNKHPVLPLGMSNRNMGKHDLWIAATSATYGLTLITTDKDFDHLNGVFLAVNRVLPADLRPLLKNSPS